MKKPTVRLAAIFGSVSAVSIPQIDSGIGVVSPDTEAPSLTLLPQDDGSACLDGSPYGVYFQKSATKSTKWTIFLQGGGWCYDEAGCLERSKGSLGSSTQFAETKGCGCMNLKDDASPDDLSPLDDECNCLYLPYGDGASFSGYLAEPLEMPGTEEKIYFRGIRNLYAGLAFAKENGFDDATDVVVTGDSAGGLSTFLHTDKIAAMTEAQVIGAPVVGYFLDHDDYNHTDANYTAQMKYIYSMQNLTFGSDGYSGLTPACQEAFGDDSPHYCFMSPHMHPYISTPYYVFNSRFDSWQLNSELLHKDTWDNDDEKEAVLQYGEDFLEQFEPGHVEDWSINGGFITTCVCHGCPWPNLFLEGLNSYQHYRNWVVGETGGKDSYQIDRRPPNGNGTLTINGCDAF